MTLHVWPVARVKSSSHAEFYRTLPSITKPISEVWFKLLLTCVYIMSKNNLGYETCRIMFIKMTTKSKFSPRSSKNGAIGLNTLYSFSSSVLNPLTLNLWRHQFKCHWTFLIGRWLRKDRSICTILVSGFWWHCDVATWKSTLSVLVQGPIARLCI